MQRILSSSHPLHFVSSFFTFLNSYILFYFLLSVLLLLLPLLHVNLHTMAAALLPEQSQKLLQLHQLCAFLFHFQHRLNAKTKDIHAVDIRRQTSFTCWNNLEICFLLTEDSSMILLCLTQIINAVVTETTTTDRGTYFTWSPFLCIKWSLNLRTPTHRHTHDDTPAPRWYWTLLYGQ